MASLSVIELLEPPLSRLSELKQDAKSLRTRAAISKNEKIFLDLVIALADAYHVTKKNLKTKMELQADIEPSLLESVVNQTKKNVNEVAELLRMVQKSHPIILPLGTEGLIRDISSRLTTNKLDFFLNISHSQEYSTAPGLLKDIISKIKDNGGKLPENFDEKLNLVLITFYANQSKDILRHSVFAHELGHVLIEFDKKFETGHLDCVNLLNNGLQALMVKHSVAISTNVVLETQLIQVALSWAEEFFVDLVSIYSLGPSAFLAMKEMGSEEWDFSTSMSLTHPAFYKRIFVLWRALEKLDFIPLLPTDMKTKLENYVKFCSDFKFFDASLAVASNKYLSDLNDIFTADFLEKFIDKFLSLKLPGAYTSKTYTDEVDSLVSLFELGIAACEIPVLNEKKFLDVSGASILNSAWIIEHKKTLSSEIINPILNKALTNHYLKIQWQGAQ